MKLLALFLAVLTVAYLLPVSALAEKKADDTVIRGEIEVSGNTEASYPDETNIRTPERQTEIFLDNSDDPRSSGLLQERKPRYPRRRSFSH